MRRIVLVTVLLPLLSLPSTACLVGDDELTPEELGELESAVCVTPPAAATTINLPPAGQAASATQWTPPFPQPWTIQVNGAWGQQVGAKVRGSYEGITNPGDCNDTVVYVKTYGIRPFTGCWEPGPSRQAYGIWYTGGAVGWCDLEASLTPEEVGSGYAALRIYGYALNQPDGTAPLVTNTAIHLP